ncbi:MAG TPA: hypothetical protein VFS82_11220 [Lysobacter sp.]|nr:hypothetical protein [Lysobacter sp.]
MKRKLTDEQQWARHGYLFFTLFGGIFVGLGMAGVRLFGIPTDVPLRDVLGHGKFLLFLVFMAACVIAAYYIALFVSDKVKAVLSKLLKL